MNYSLLKKFTINFFMVLVVRSIFIFISRFLEFEIYSRISVSIGLAIGLTYGQWVRENRS
ncbi:hypothetical protein [Crassaminicella profunda]|uniref:hypothetical protein n=1 Tax=Crassaminicella profunda TaxID=1286698 RepID=UPI001CA687D2|nr:hypothetical protein [Crassaminicella profunda]QZY55967.1 hypothetical protein K7H06_02815 [Crassaminicella profunda]